MVEVVVVVVIAEVVVAATAAAVAARWAGGWPLQDIRLLNQELCTTQYYYWH